MCGIVGHLGPQNSVETVLEGLKRLEYRGYDSAGVSFVDEHNELCVFKKSGKLENLKRILEGKNLVARSCIGHTRWATHGEVNDTNSHPHSNDKIAMVHNGIIENATTLKRELIEKGIKFHSETDSEVFLALLSDQVSQDVPFKQAIINSFHRITGNSAFVILNSETSEIYAIKRGAPLVCGINETSSEGLVSSDPYALAGMVHKLYFPEDDVLCHLSAANKNLLNFYELDGTKTRRYMSKTPDISATASDKGDYDHFMLKEIHEQPELIRSLTQYYFAGEGESALQDVANLRPERVHISACGTAFYAGLMIKDFLEQYNQIPTVAEIASEFRYKNPLIKSGEMGLFVSQSGETADTLAAQELCTEKGLDTISIVNVEGSTLYRNCNHNLIIRAGVEIGVASTKAFTQQVLTGRLLSYALSGDLNNPERRVALASQFNLLAERVDYLLAQEEKIKAIAKEIYERKGYFYTGRGMYFPIALEGALKLKEIAYVHAEGYASGELKHGPIALIDSEMVNVAIVGPELYDKTVSNIQEIRARKGIILTIGPKGDTDLEEISDFYISLDFSDLGDLGPLYVNVVNQMLAYYIALYKGTDIDKPRNLAKSVTVE